VTRLAQTNMVPLLHFFWNSQHTSTLHKILHEDVSSGAKLCFPFSQALVGVACLPVTPKYCSVVSFGGGGFSTHSHATQELCTKASPPTLSCKESKRRVRDSRAPPVEGGVDGCDARALSA